MTHVLKLNIDIYGHGKRWNPARVPAARHAQDLGFLFPELNHRID